MNANDILTQDHRMLEDLYASYLQAEGDERMDLARRILTELTVHAGVEEELYYPALEDRVDQATADQYRDSHNDMKGKVTGLSAKIALSNDDPEAMADLMQEVVEHAREEEESGMPRMQEALGTEQLEELGSKIEARKNELRESTLKRLWASLPA